jgi:hypothetical protein
MFKNHKDHIVFWKKFKNEINSIIYKDFYNPYYTFLMDNKYYNKVKNFIVSMNLNKNDYEIKDYKNYTKINLEWCNSKIGNLPCYLVDKDGYFNISSAYH